MIYIIFAIVLFIFMAFLPIGFGLYVLKNKKSEKLIITGPFIDDPEYFGDKYKGVFDNKWKNRKAGNVVDLDFKQNEHIIEADYAYVYPEICEDIVYAEHKDFAPPAGTIFTKHIYANENAYLIGTHSIVGIYSKKNILLGNGIDVVLWVDAEGTVAVEEGCNLGIMTSSDRKIFIGGKCIFNKLYAPKIYLNCSFDFIKQMDNDKNANDFKFRKLEAVRNLKYVDEDTADEKNILKKTIITKYELNIDDGMIVLGDIRTHKGINIGENVIICGNVFAEDDIFVGKNSRILGNVFTQRDFRAQEGVVIGQKNKIKSVIARDRIYFNKNCMVYGYVDCEDIGKVLDDD